MVIFYSYVSLPEGKPTKMISIYCRGLDSFCLIFITSQKSVFQHPKVGETTNHFMGYDGFGPPKNGWDTPKLPLRNWENDEPWILGVPSGKPTVCDIENGHRNSRFTH